MRGIVTTASLMVGAAALADAVARARRRPSLRVGLHLTLVDGRPTLPASSVPDLVDRDGRFRDDMARAGAAMFLRPSVRRQLAAEIEAQFIAFRATGLVLDHVNAHKHFHLHPTVASTLIAVGKRFGLRAVRVPAEPHRLLAQIDGSTAAGAAGLRPWTALLRRRVRRAGLYAADRVFGLAWSGSMTAERVTALIRRLPDGTSELYAHPAMSDGFAGAVPGYRHAAEFAALTSPEVAAAVRESGARLAAFSDLVAR